MKHFKKIIAFVSIIGVILLSPSTVYATTIGNSSQNSATTGTAISVSAPTGTAVGDVVIIAVSANGQVTLADNNGATPFTADIANYQPNTTNGQTLSLYSRRIKAGDPSTYNFTTSVSDRWAIVAMDVQNPNATSIYDVTPTTGNATNRDSSGDGTAVTATITTVTNNAIHVIVAQWDTSLAGTITTPVGYTLAANANGGGEPVHMSTKLISPIGATGAQSVVNTQFGAYITFSFALKDSGTAVQATSQVIVPGNSQVNVSGNVMVNAN